MLLSTEVPVSNTVEDGRRNLLVDTMRIIILSTKQEHEIDASNSSVVYKKTQKKNKSGIWNL